MVISYCGRGVTRHVWLVGRYAFKLPRLNHGWRLFLRGLLCNMQEASFGTSKLDGFCPVAFAIPGGWLTVQRRARVMSEEEYDAFDRRKFCERADYRIPAEPKPDSFGWLDGKVVAIDYGEG